MVITSRPEAPTGTVFDPTAIRLIEMSISELMKEFDSIGYVSITSGGTRHMSQAKHDAIMELLTSIEELLEAGKL